MFTLNAWANLVVSGKESGDRQPCRITIDLSGFPNGDNRLCLDRELRFMAGRSGMAEIAFFMNPEGEDRYLTWPFSQAADSGFTFALTRNSPAPNPQAG